MIRLNTSGDAVTLAVRIQPRAPQSALRGELEGALKIAIAAPPVDGAANEELVRFLAKFFRISRQSVTIISGQTSRHKVISLKGVTEETVLARLTADER
jgi:uncharacterized protein